MSCHADDLKFFRSLSRLAVTLFPMEKSTFVCSFLIERTETKIKQRRIARGERIELNVWIASMCVCGTNTRERCKASIEWSKEKRGTSWFACVGAAIGCQCVRIGKNRSEVTSTVVGWTCNRWSWLAESTVRAQDSYELSCAEVYQLQEEKRSIWSVDLSSRSRCCGPGKKSFQCKLRWEKTHVASPR